MEVMRRRASERVRVGTFWNSPSLRSAVASSSPPAFSRVRDVGAVAIIKGCRRFESCAGYGGFESLMWFSVVWRGLCWRAK